MISICFIGCAVHRQIPINNFEKDTIVIKELVRDTLIIPQIEKEYIEVTTKDTISVLNTQLATSTAKINNNQLFHTLEQKPTKTPIKIQYKDRIIEKVKVEHKEVPVDVPVPYRDNIFWYSVICNIIFVGLTAFRVIRALKIV
jgi:hypothetical protein